MGPKKGKKAKKGVVIDGVDTTDMSREKLEVFALRLREELQKERDERNFFQLERDKLRTFWEITRQHLEECRCEVRNKERQNDEAEVEHLDLMRKERQKLKHVLYEHQSDLAERKAENMVWLKMARDEYNEQELELLRDKRELKEQLRELGSKHLGQLQEEKQEHGKLVSKIRDNFDTKSREIEEKYGRRINTLRQEMILKHRMELTEVQERKNAQLSEMARDHDKAMGDIQQYYNELTNNNLSLITRLKEQMEESRLREDRVEKEMREVKAENRKLAGPLKATREEVAVLRKNMAYYQKDKMALGNARRKLDAAEKEVGRLTWEGELLQTQLDKVSDDRNELRERFAEATQALQRQAGRRQAALERRVRGLELLLEERDVRLGELEPEGDAPPATCARLETAQALLEAKNAEIDHLKAEVSRLCKAHDDLLETYEAKLQRLGVPLEEMGFTPVREAKTGRGRPGRGPAGLVASNP